jgi:hypothetical protein
MPRKQGRSRRRAASETESGERGRGLNGETAPKTSRARTLTRARAHSNPATGTSRTRTRTAPRQGDTTCPPPPSPPCRLTSRAWVSAPAASSARTTGACPLYAAPCRAVRPFCGARGGSRARCAPCMTCVRMKIESLCACVLWRGGGGTTQKHTLAFLNSRAGHLLVSILLGPVSPAHSRTSSLLGLRCEPRGGGRSQRREQEGGLKKGGWDAREGAAGGGVQNMRYAH